jgi:hypothetical protein
MLRPNQQAELMKNHDDHPSHEELRRFLEKHGEEILEVVREQNLTGVDDATRLQSALTELSYRWGVLPPPGTTLEDLFGDDWADEEEPS